MGARPGKDSGMPAATLAARGPVAQLAEQGTFNPKVAGSNPARPILHGMVEPKRLETVGQVCQEGQVWSYGAYLGAYLGQGS